MEYKISSSQTFDTWFDSLKEDAKIDVFTIIRLLKELGPKLPFPYSSKIQGSKISHLRELRIQHKGKPYRVLYAFDPTRQAFLILGGDKTGKNRWYKKSIKQAEKIYLEHLKEIGDL